MKRHRPGGAARQARILEAMALGICASFFFAFTFVLNRRMSIQGGSWVWSAALRFFFMLPILLALSAAGGGLGGVLAAIRRRPLGWIAWSSVGFGLFYSFLCAASSFGPAWLIAATWQVTIVAGALLSPLFYDKVPAEGGRRPLRHRIPARAIAAGSVILAGIFLMQLREASMAGPGAAPACVALVLVAAFSYPLGNRKMMELCDRGLSTLQRVTGMTICSMPFWAALAAIGLAKDGLPSPGQLFQSSLVAIFSGVVATLLFFKATDLVHGDARSLAAVESTQSGEVVFTLAFGVLAFGDRPPTALGLAGLALVILGMIANSLASARAQNAGTTAPL
jgi:drug/metabolite transporter (DMT)-like permease